MDLQLVQRVAFDIALRFGQLKSRDVLTVDKAIDFPRDAEVTIQLVVVVTHRQG